MLSIRFTPTEASVGAGMLAAQNFVLLAIFMAVTFAGGMSLMQAGTLDWGRPRPSAPRLCRIW
ncbi:hypothetical protein [Caulobacter zeae]|nr:hypothetical protein [Caulobacter zeae]